MNQGNIRKEIAGRIADIGCFLVENCEALTADLEATDLDSIDLRVDPGLPGSFPTVAIDKTFIVLPRAHGGA